ncbi:MAG: class I SAM-dependent methyltransferase [bacterium]
MAERTYMKDGELLTIAELRQRFPENNVPLGKRQRKVIGLIEGERVLDVGCYYGAFAYAVSTERPECAVVGVDYVDDHVDAAGCLFQRENLQYQKADVYQLPYPEESFDCVCLQNVIEHLDEPATALREIYRVMKPGGVFILTTDNIHSSRLLKSFLKLEIMNCIRSLLGRKKAKPGLVVFHENIEWDHHLYGWDLRTLNTLLCHVGFEYVSHEYVESPEGIIGSLFPFLKNIVVLKSGKCVREHSGGT